MSSQYGMASAISDALGGYEQQEERAIKIKGAERTAEKEGYQLDKLRADSEREGSKEALRLMLSGDTEGAMAAFNAQGDKKMTELEYDPEEKFVSWVDEEGNEVSALLPEVFLRAGVDPAELQTQAEGAAAKQKGAMDLQEHKYAMQKKYDVGRGGARPSGVQTSEWIMQNLTDENGKPISANKAFEMATAGKVSQEKLYFLARNQVMKLHKDVTGEIDATPEQIDKETNEALDAWLKRKNMPKGGNPEPAPALTTGAINRDAPNPKRLW